MSKLEKVYFYLSENESFIGKSEDCLISLDCDIADKYCSITCDRGLYKVLNLTDNKEIKLNDNAIDKEAILQDLDIISFLNYSLKLFLDKEGAYIELSNK